MLEPIRSGVARDVATMFDELWAMAGRQAELHADRARLQARVPAGRQTGTGAAVFAGAPTITGIPIFSGIPSLTGGAIKIPRIGGRYVSIRATAALAKAQRYDDINNERQFYETIAGLYGPEMVALVSKPEEVAARFAELFQVRKDPLRTKIEIKALMQQMQQAAQQMQQAQAPQGQTPPQQGA